MAHFTQLGVSTNQEVKPQGKTLPNITQEKQRPHLNEKPGGKQRTAVLVASLIATALLGVFVLESGCSQESNKTATIANPTQTAASPMSALMSPAPMPTSTAVATQPPAKKKSRQHKLSASTYTNPAYGVSFRYPKYDSLKQGDEANLELDDLGSPEMNFVEPGGSTISAVELPRKFYAGTDFASAFFNVSVNPKLTAAECEEFAFVDADDPESNPAPSKTKVGATEFHAVETFSEQENNQSDVKYYHVFQNGNCYEFALGVETVAEIIPDDSKDESNVKPVNRQEVFRQLNWMLSTVKVQTLALPEKPEVAADAPPVAANTAITEAH
jgi:hypothetical protein